jgi:hypothetical protein
MQPNRTLCSTEVHRFLIGLFDGNMRAKRVLSFNVTLGRWRHSSRIARTADVLIQVNAFPRSGDNHFSINRGQASALRTHVNPVGGNDEYDRARCLR